MITFLTMFFLVSCLAPPVAPACMGVICHLGSNHQGGLSRCTENCGALYVTSRDGREERFTGSRRRTRVRDVARVRLVGTGCFLIFRGSNFAGESYRVAGGNTHVLKEKGHDWTTLRYSCTCQLLVTLFILGI